MKDPKFVKTRRSYDPDFKQEVIRMLVSGRSARETSEAFGIAENVLYRWRRMAGMAAHVAQDDANSMLHVNR